MTNDVLSAAREAAILTRAGRLKDAVRVIQSAMTGGIQLGAPPTRDGFSSRRPTREQDPEEVRSATPWRTARLHHTTTTTTARKKGLGNVVAELRRARQLAVSPAGLRSKISPKLQIPEGARFLTKSFTNQSGTRAYKVYLPRQHAVAGLPLVVMLHGCTQNPDDFAIGTKMNDLAESVGFVVAYPHQPAAANASSCWNWFRPGDQGRGAGEPSIIAGLTGEITTIFGLDMTRVFVAGFSAGGAMAAVMAATYPDIYAAAGIHSGLAYKSASDLVSAFAAMRGERGSRVQVEKVAAVRTIVFQGSADRTVKPSNAERIVTAFSSSADMPSNLSTGVHGGVGFRRATFLSGDGASQQEYWLVEGCGHAWAGGNPRGSFATATGPDASAEMVRFFLHDRLTVSA